jgi:argininosuccinate lyase
LNSKARTTTVGVVRTDILDFTVGRDRQLDMALLNADCIGTAAHVTMLSRMPVKPSVFTAPQCAKVIRALGQIMIASARGRFAISLEDQDVHLALERQLTARLGALGRNVHTGRSRNDQVALDLRLFAKEQILAAIDEALNLADALIAQARRHLMTPMVGRTHMQPAMPSSVGLWATAHAESLVDDALLLKNAFELNDQCPLGSAASYGVPLPIDREMTAELLGFSRPIHNVLYANNARGKIETIILAAMGQVMLSLAKLAQDLMLYTMPEFNYFSIPKEFCTGSSIMPQKNNPDVLELVRAKAATVFAHEMAVAGIVRGLPSGYNRDLQETKGPFMDGIATTRGCLEVMSLLIQGMEVHAPQMRAAFSPAVFATDRALELAAKGMPFRDAYQHIKAHMDELAAMDPGDAVLRKTHWGATAGLDLDAMGKRLEATRRFAASERMRYHRAVTRLMNVQYPLHD